MGIVNVTPDSFSDGGLFDDQEAAIAHGISLVNAGADIVDVGGESTRPGAYPITIAQELYRVTPVIEALVNAGCTVSIDTMHAEVAAKTIELGATIVNDVSGGLVDPAIIEVIAQNPQITYIASHYRAPAGTPDTHLNPLPEVVAEIADRRDAILNSGVKPEQLILDPGLGFAKNTRTNWAILRGLDQIINLGFPVLVGASRKRFLKELLVSLGSAAASLPLAPQNDWLLGAPQNAVLNAELDKATAAVSALAAAAGVWGVRVHNVADNREAVAAGQIWRAKAGR